MYICVWWCSFVDNSNIQCCNCYVYGGAVLLTTVTLGVVTVMCMVMQFC